ncbi:hypothetical protein OUZ56_001149 [Daphnia magna]|uniref:Uncharacterized protein n=1 Tax=Daphnia magna TaxID=35525 RepID=A0ABR0A2E2_9CRUS|nr:hypothetical protein OUZ56_001149 [Daphnia magna]
MERKWFAKENAKGIDGPLTVVEQAKTNFGAAMNSAVTVSFSHSLTSSTPREEPDLCKILSTCFYLTPSRCCLVIFIQSVLIEFHHKLD